MRELKRVFVFGLTVVVMSCFAHSTLLYAAENEEMKLNMEISTEADMDQNAEAGAKWDIEQTAQDFLMDFYTVSYEEAKELFQAYESEAKSKIEEIHAQEGIITWESEVLKELLEEDPFVMLTEDAAEKVKSNRHLMVPYSFAQDRRQDITAENCELTVQYVEEDRGSYTFEMELQSWEGKTLAQAIGSMILEKQEEEWKIVSLILDGIISEDMQESEQGEILIGGENRCE